VLCVAGAALAQQFDSTGDSPPSDFVFGTEGIDSIDVPSLGEGGTLPQGGPDVQLQITQGQSGVAMQTFPGTGTPITSVFQPETSQASGMVLRALDKMLGRPADIALALEETVTFGRLVIRAVECRFPTEDPTSDAFAHIEILDLEGNMLFNGWMIASSPALSALEHARYDIWVLRCEGA
jgi:hypothetical protein